MSKCLINLNKWSADSALRSSTYIDEDYFCASCYSIQTLLSSRLLSKNLKIKIYKTIIFPAVLYEYEELSLIFKEERTLRVFEN